MALWNQTRASARPLRALYVEPKKTATLTVSDVHPLESRTYVKNGVPDQQMALISAIKRSTPPHGTP